ncbi:MAG: NAD(P)-binding domain-containing protein, partial [Gammaproteobacteria bacterium]|nr:NAD(P)-binding domain-containing protein [Gammaproteobacteria bacterium]
MLLATSASADTIAIIGTGDVARALGPAFARQGHAIVYGSREPGRESVRNLVTDTGTGASATLPAAAVVDADFVVLAVPGLLVGEITRGLGNLDGKIIIDPTNPLEFEPLT